MLTTAGVSSNDSRLEAAVSTWLVDSRMPLPDGFRLHVEVVDEVGAWDDPREIFPQGDTDVRAGEPLGWVHLTWRAAPARARVEADIPEALIELSRAALEQEDWLFRSFLLITLIFLWKRHGYYHVHAATAIDPHGRGWMLIGNSCSGKSTTTALLASRGWQVSTDDIAFLTSGGDRAAVRGFRSRVALRAGGYELLQRPGGTALTSRRKTGFWPEELGATWIPVVKPDIILFTSVAGERTMFRAATPQEIMQELLQWSLWVMFESTNAQEHLDLLAQLGRQAKCYRATFAPDLFAAPEGLEAFLP
ncbi:MAG: hypothetical protein ACREL5_03595 [Gemmatimonadales bacterium]